MKQEDTKGIIKLREGVTNTTATKAPSNSERDVPISGAIPVEAIYKDTSEISYTPERNMQHGLQMLRNVKNYVNELDVGSSVRKNIWLRDISKYVFCCVGYEKFSLMIPVALRNKVPLRQ